MIWRIGFHYLGYDVIRQFMSPGEITNISKFLWLGLSNFFIEKLCIFHLSVLIKLGSRYQWTVRQTWGGFRRFRSSRHFRFRFRKNFLAGNNWRAGGTGGRRRRRRPGTGCPSWTTCRRGTPANRGDGISVTKLGDLLDFRQLFKVFGNN